MFWNKKRKIFGAAIALTLASAALLKDYQKEHKPSDKREQIIAQVEAQLNEPKKSTKIKERKIVPDDYGRTDAGYDVTSQIKQLLEIAKRLQDLEIFLDKESSNSVSTELRSFKKKFTSESLNTIDIRREAISELQDEFLKIEQGDYKKVIGASDNREGKIEEIKEEIAYKISEMIKENERIKKAVEELSNAQIEISDIKEKLSHYQQTEAIKETQDKLEELETEIMGRIQTYDVDIEINKSLIAKWEKFKKELK